MLPIKKINTMEHKKMQELQNKIIGQGNNIGLTKGVVPDPRKRQFIRKWILGIIAGIGIAIFSKVAHAGGIKFAGEQDAELMDSSRGVAKCHGSSDSSGVLQAGSHNFASITRNTSPHIYYTWNIDNNMADSNYTALAVSTSGNPTQRDIWSGSDSHTVGTFNSEMWDDSAADYVDGQIAAIVFGDQ